jgi:NADPH:quinone reductase-like Zn-dependent oxidoreductase
MAMKAGRISRFGGPQVLEIVDVPTPRPQAGEVLVALRAAGVNRVDVVVREGAFAGAPMPLVLGAEGVGEVAELGPGVTQFSPGDRVVVNPFVACDECPACAAGRETECPNLRVVGEHFDGTYAEYIVLPARSLLPAPDGLGYPELAASTVAYMTAWHMLKTKARVRPGETVLVVGAGSGVGSAAVQVAKVLGATVIATTSTGRKQRQLRALGADEVVNYREEPDFHESVRALTGGLGVDVVHETVGLATMRKSILSARRGGRVVGMGSHTGSLVELDLRTIYQREITLIGCHLANRAEIAEFLPLLADGTLVPVVDSVFGLEDAGAAHVRLTDPERFGKVVLAIPGKGA